MNGPVLVTGAAGFMGSHLARELSGDPELKVIAVDDLSGGFVENLPSGVEFRMGSVADAKFISALFDEWKFRYIYHLAAYAAEGLSHFIRRFNYQNNVIGSATLINEAVKHESECFVFTSSIAVYGAAQVPMREDMAPRPADPYGIAKYAVELDLAAAAEMFGLDYVVFRPHNVYGPHQNIGDRYRNVVGIFMNQIRSGRPLTVFGDGSQKRAFTFIDDVTSVIVDAPRCEGARNRVFNLGSDEAHSVNELAEAVCEAMGVKDYPIAKLEPRNEVHVAYSDHMAVREVFELGQPTPLDVGLRAMAEWVKSVGVRTSGSMEVEVAKGLPSIWRD